MKIAGTEETTFQEGYCCSSLQSDCGRAPAVLSGTSPQGDVLAVKRRLCENNQAVLRTLLEAACVALTAVVVMA